MQNIVWNFFPMGGSKKAEHKNSICKVVSIWISLRFKIKLSTVFSKVEISSLLSNCICFLSVGGERFLITWMVEAEGGFDSKKILPIYDNCVIIFSHVPSKAQIEYTQMLKSEMLSSEKLLETSFFLLNRSKLNTCVHGVKWKLLFLQIMPLKMQPVQRLQDLGHRDQPTPFPVAHARIQGYRLSLECM